jgi:hypothetical protein
MTIGATHLGEALGTDFFSVREQFTDEQWDKFVTVRRFVDTEVVPVAGQYWERAEIAWDLVRRLPELGIVGGSCTACRSAGLPTRASSRRRLRAWPRCTTRARPGPSLPMPVTCWAVTESSLRIM